MAPTLQLLDPCDGPSFDAWYAAFREAAVADRTASMLPMVFSREELAASLRTPSTERRRVPVGAWLDGAVAGTLLVEIPLREDRQTASFDIGVVPAHRGRGLGTRLLEHAERVAADEGRTVHEAEVDVPEGVDEPDQPGLRFARRHGFATEHVEQHLLADPIPSPARLEALADAAADVRPGYTFTGWTGRCPDTHVDAYAAMSTAMARDVPTGTLRREPAVWDAARVRANEQRHAAHGFTPIVTAARAPDGTFAGYSLLYALAHQPGDALQDDTLVLRRHRGHRLGAALKARNLAVLRREFPGRRAVHTWVDPENAPMREINRRFGFRPVATLHEMQRTVPAR